MPLFHDLRTLLFDRGKRDPVIDLHLTQAGGLQRGPGEAELIPSHPAAILIAPTPPADHHADPIASDEDRPGSHTRTLSVVTLDEVMQHLADLRRQLEAHRSDHTALDSRASHLSERLDAIQPPLDAAAQTLEHMMQVMQQLHAMQADLLNADRTCSQQLDRVIEATASADSRLRSALRRLGLWVAAALAINALAAIAAITLAILALQHR